MITIFLSYRRDDSSGQAGRLYDHLSQHFGTDNVFMDVDAIDLGIDFKEALRQAVKKCDVMLAIIGPAWLDCVDKETGKRRLDDPNDWVLIETTEALQRAIPVIPVLVRGAELPAAKNLPDTLAPLVDRQATILSDSQWSVGIADLVNRLKAIPRHRETEMTQRWLARFGLRRLAMLVVLMVAMLSAALWLLWPGDVVVPPLVGRSLPEARMAIETEGLEFRDDQVVCEESLIEPAGKVIRQEPTAGLRVSKGQPIRIVVAKVPPPIDLSRFVNIRDVGTEGTIAATAAVMAIEVAQVFRRSLYNEVLISLGKRAMAEAVEPPWKQFVELPSQRRHLILQDSNIKSVFDATGLLLILGDPGSGKTTTLLELASELIERARSDPKERVPIVLNLSSWKKKQPLTDWIAEELSSKYRIPVKTGQAWLKNDYILPLLDGLDEVQSALRPACVASINEYVEQFRPSGLVVCCRLMEYQWLPERLKLNGASCLELLGSEEVNEFLDSGGPQLAALRKAMNADLVLQELSQTPLMLSIMCLAYEGVGGRDLSKQEAGSNEDRRGQIFNLYVDRMFQRKESTTNLSSKDKVISWLARLAKGMKKHSQTVFMVEGLQPSWLITRGQQAAYGTITALIIALINGLGFAIYIGLDSLLIGLIILLGVGLGCWFESRLRCALISALIGGLIFLLLGCLFAAWFRGQNIKPGLCMVAGFIAGMIGGIGVGSLKVIITVETLHWQWKNFWRKSIQGLIIGLVFMVITIFAVALVDGLDSLTKGFYQSRREHNEKLYLLIVGCIVFAGLYGGVISGLVGGIADTVRIDKSSANKGINLSLKNAVLSTVIVGLFLAVINWLISLQSQAPALALIIGLVAGLNRGGSAVVKHYSLRFILWMKGYTPFKFIKFLDHCAKLILLKKVGGGYMFIHRMLLEHFAAMELNPTKTRNRKEEAT